MQIPVHASCLCGGVRLRLAALPKHYYQCHCSLCRKQGGAASNAATIVQTDHITWDNGTQLVARYQRPSGFTVHFCQACGSPLPNTVGDGTLTWFPLGILDDAAPITLAAHLFAGSKAPWETAPSAGSCFNEMPPMPEFLATLRGDP